MGGTKKLMIAAAFGLAGLIAIPAAAQTNGQYDSGRNNRGWHKERHRDHDGDRDHRGGYYENGRNGNYDKGRWGRGGDGMEVTTTAVITTAVITMELRSPQRRLQRQLPRGQIPTLEDEVLTASHRRAAHSAAFHFLRSGTVRRRLLAGVFVVLPYSVPSHSAQRPANGLLLINLVAVEKVTELTLVK